jgi:hypothetical protein
MELADFLCGRFYKYAAPTALEKRGAIFEEQETT